ncbi:MAG: hypothetical protein WDN08_15395 [Rhizomicrobium sp.]
MGQGIEFDYCCCHAAFSLSESGFETIHGQLQSGDGLDRLRHLRPSLFRAADRRGRIGDRARRAVERHAGRRDRAVRRPDAAQARQHAGRRRRAILGTSADAIDLAEDRKRFQVLLTELGLKQPRNATALTADETIAAARAIGYPVILRPSYVLGGRGMVVCADEAHLKTQVQSGELFRISGENPVLIDRFLHHAIEVDVDAICDSAEQVFISGIMEHIEKRACIPAIPPAHCRPTRSAPQSSRRSSVRPSPWRGR